MADTSYLGLLERPLDDQQMKVCCSKGYTIVAAGAGSGKTHVLATRFAYLVMTENIPVDRILTLTFTDKAAAEMYERIYKSLCFFAENVRVGKTERSRAAKAVADFSNAHIQTLDSYCASIVRQCANRYGIRPDFTIGKNADCSNLALPFVLEHRNDSAVKEVSDAGHLEDIASDLFAGTVNSYTSLADQENFFTAALPAQRQEITDSWNSVLQKFAIQLTEIRDVFTAAPDEKKEMPYCIALAQAVKAADEASIVSVTDAEIQNGSARTYVQTLRDAAAGFAFNQNQKGYTAALRDAVRPVKNEFLPLIGECADYILHYDTAKRIYALLDEFLAQVNKTKRQTGSLTFRDVTELALRILREQEDIRAQEKSAYSAIMIDEFQDNNGKNREMLDLISDSNLFYVGDEKQSIYKFRGADVAVFNNLKKEITEKGGNVYSMIYNYRSTPQLLSSFNCIFGGYEGKEKTEPRSPENDMTPVSWIFPEKPEQPFEAGFTRETIAGKFDTDLKQPVMLPALTAEDVLVHVCMLNKAGILSSDDKGDYLADKDQIAFFITRKIHELHASGVPYSDIAVLDRSRTDRGTLMRSLGRADIPYVVDQQQDLFAEAPVNDICSFIRLCVYPSDMNAFAAFICSPFAGLDEQSCEAVLAVLSDTKNADAVFIPFDETKKDSVRSELSDDMFARYEYASKLYTEYASYVQCHRISDTVTRLWYECGYRYDLMWNKSLLLYGEQYDFLFELARQADTAGQSASWFIDQLGRKRSEEDSDLNAEDISYPLEDRNAVQVMTIHKSKGLQFGYVFLCGCTGKQKSDRNGDHVYYSEKYGVSLNFRGGSGNHFYSMQKEESDLKAAAEFRRIIYVGITRAEKQVFIPGIWNRDSDKDPKTTILQDIIIHYYPDKADSPDDSGSTVYAEHAPFDFTSIRPVKRSEANSGTRGDLSGREKLSFAEKEAALYDSAGVIAEAEAANDHITPSSLEPEFTAQETLPVSGTPDTYRAVNELAAAEKYSFTAFGTLVHAYLEAYALGTEPEDFSADQYLSKLDSARDRSRIIDCCVRMVHSFAESAEGKAYRETVSAGLFHKAEYAFKSYLAGYYITGSIDLLYRNKDGSYTIVDYKTDQVKHPELYTGQQALYRKAASEILGTDAGNVSCRLFYLRYGETADITASVEGLTEAQLAEKAAEAAGTAENEN